MKKEIVIIIVFLVIVATLLYFIYIKPNMDENKERDKIIEWLQTFENSFDIQYVQVSNGVGIDGKRTTIEANDYQNLINSVHSVTKEQIEFGIMSLRNGNQTLQDLTIIVKSKTPLDIVDQLGNQINEFIIRFMLYDNGFLGFSGDYVVLNDIIKVNPNTKNINQLW